MKLPLLFLFLFSFVACEWTCQSCQDATDALAQDSLTDGVLQSEIALLLSEICLDTSAPENCTTFLPEFWKKIAKVVSIFFCLDVILLSSLRYTLKPGPIYVMILLILVMNMVLIGPAL